MDVVSWFGANEGGESKLELDATTPVNVSTLAHWQSHWQVQSLLRRSKDPSASERHHMSSYRHSSCITRPILDYSL